MLGAAGPRPDFLSFLLIKGALAQKLLVQALDNVWMVGRDIAPLLLILDQVEERPC
jgi:hypothetical protein